jgi:threonine aldolase
MDIIDLRSDTLTLPTPGMREAMHTADLGDDLFGEDPTVKQLEETTAELLGTEAALFVPSGTMSNLLGLRVLGRPGDAVIGDADSHVFIYETGGLSAALGYMAYTIPTSSGTLGPEDVAAKLMPANIHHPRTRILAVENTHNRAGGTVWNHARFVETCTFAYERGMAVHLDGARLWNACVTSGTKPTDWSKHVDTVNVCFSKGLGAPVGSALGASAELIDEARFYRKMFGGQMRQAGVIAAGALYALKHHRERLAEDHANAQAMAAIIDHVDGLSTIAPQSNILMVNLTPGPVTAAMLVHELSRRGVKVLPIREFQLRIVANLNTSADECRQAAEQFAPAYRAALTGLPQG